MATRSYASDLSDGQWVLIERHIPPARQGGRPRRVDTRAVVNAIFYLLRTGCQWRLLPKDFPPWGTVWWYFRRWRREGNINRDATLADAAEKMEAWLRYYNENRPHEANGNKPPILLQNPSGTPGPSP